MCVSIYTHTFSQRRHGAQALYNELRERQGGGERPWEWVVVPPHAGQAGWSERPVAPLISSCMQLLMDKCFGAVSANAGTPAPVTLLTLLTMLPAGATPSNLTEVWGTGHATAAGSAEPAAVGWQQAEHLLLQV